MVPHNGRGFIRYIVLVSLLACNHEADYAQVRHDCKEEIAQWRSIQPPADVVALIGKNCASTLGESIGLEWDSFGFEAASLSGSETGAYVLSGLLTVAASDTGTLNTLMVDPDLPIVVKDGLICLTKEQSFTQTTPASEVWYSFIRASIQSTTFAESVSSGAGGGYSSSDDSVVFAPEILGWDGTLIGAALPAFSASVLVHEASHRVTERHHQCINTRADRNCDASPEGSYGIEVWWLHHWMLSYPQVLTDPGCTELDNLKSGACTVHIENTEGWEPCERVCL